MAIEKKGNYLKIDNTLIRITKIDSVKIRHIVKANNFGKVSNDSFPEIIISVNAQDKHVFQFETEELQMQAFADIENIISE